MEANGVHVVVNHAAGHLFTGEPTFVATFKLHLVAVFASFGGTQDGAQLGQFDLADACQLVKDLLLLHLQLLGVG